MPPISDGIGYRSAAITEPYADSRRGGIIPPLDQISRQLLFLSGIFVWGAAEETVTPPLDPIYRQILFSGDASAWNAHMCARYDVTPLRQLYTVADLLEHPEP